MVLQDLHGFMWTFEDLYGFTFARLVARVNFFVEFPELAWTYVDLPGFMELTWILLYQSPDDRS